MNSLIASKLHARRCKLANERQINITEQWPSNDRFQKNIAFLKAYTSNSQTLRNGPVVRLKATLRPTVANVAMHFQTGDIKARKLAFVRYVTQEFLTCHLSLERLRLGKQVNALMSHAALAHQLAQLHCLGWHEEASWLAHTVWSNPGHTLAQNGNTPSLIPNELFAWFMSYFTLGSNELISAAGVTEPYLLKLPYKQLLEHWKSADSTMLQELMADFSEENMVRSLMSFSQAPADSLEDLWWYVPYDVYAIQQCRVSAGLEPVRFDDLRVDIQLTDLQDAPLVQDDLIWPAYLRACDDDGIEPYARWSTIQVKTDPATLELTLR